MHEALLIGVDVVRVDVADEGSTRGKPLACEVANERKGQTPKVDAADERNIESGQMGEADGWNDIY